MGTDCAPLFADFFYLGMIETLWCLYLPIIKLIVLTHLTQYVQISTVDNLLNIDNPYFEQIAM